MHIAAFVAAGDCRSWRGLQRGMRSTLSQSVWANTPSSGLSNGFSDDREVLRARKIGIWR